MRLTGEILLALLQPLLQRAFVGEKLVVRLLQDANLMLAATTTLEADQVQSRQKGPFALDPAKGDDIVFNAGHTADHSMSANPHELMHGRQSAEESEIAYMHM